MSHPNRITGSQGVAGSIPASSTKKRGTATPREAVSVQKGKRSASAPHSRPLARQVPPGRARVEFDVEPGSEAFARLVGALRARRPWEHPDVPSAREDYDRPDGRRREGVPPLRLGARRV